MTTRVFGDKKGFTAAPAPRRVPLTPARKPSWTKNLLVVLVVLSSVVFFLVRSGKITLP